MPIPKSLSTVDNYFRSSGYRIKQEKLERILSDEKFMDYARKAKDASITLITTYSMAASIWVLGFPALRYIRLDQPELWDSAVSYFGETSLYRGLFCVFLMPLVMAATSGNHFASKYKNSYQALEHACGKLYVKQLKAPS